jgi:NAD(P)-dependent dehydrogenase (short-subunit alcohol dehydrogenase family)
MKSILVTGASTGIGWGCVKVLTGKGFHVFGSVRKPADAERLCAEFGSKVTPLLFDVTDAPARPSSASSTMPASPIPAPCSTSTSTSSADSWK